MGSLRHPTRTRYATDFRWLVAQDPDPGVVSELAEAINVSDYLARLLVQRGITDFTAAKAFFRPSLDTLADPFLMAGMNEAIPRLQKAVTSGEKVLLYGDYDVDGTTSVALLFRVLDRLGAQVTTYQPDRHGEGYGVSREGIQYAIDWGAGLMITLDCGITAREQLSEAKALGLDVIVCDHHVVPDQLPPAVAVLNPKRADCDYPEKNLCGVGVGFTLLRGYFQADGLDPEGLYEELDLVAVGTCADLVPLTGENRTFVAEGLARLRGGRNVGLRALLEAAAIANDPTVRDAVFGLAPRINAAGRLEHASLATALLTTDDPAQAMDLSLQLNALNNDRRELEQAITESALAQLEAQWDRRTTVVFDPSWHKGVVGIVASRLLDQRYRPTIVLGGDGTGSATGSVRSVEGVNVHEALKSCADLLDKFGGHAHAAGLSLDPARIPELHDRFDAAVAQQLGETDAQPALRIDLTVGPDDLRTRSFEVLWQMAPFGPDNPAPLLLLENVQAQGAQLLKEKHLKFQVPASDGKLEVIGFGLGQLALDLVQAGPIDLVASIEPNDFRGERRWQLRIRDLRAHGEVGGGGE